MGPAWGAWRWSKCPGASSPGPEVLKFKTSASKPSCAKSKGMESSSQVISLAHRCNVCEAFKLKSVKANLFVEEKKKDLCFTTRNEFQFVSPFRNLRFGRAWGWDWQCAESALCPPCSYLHLRFFTNGPLLALGQWRLSGLQLLVDCISEQACKQQSPRFLGYQTRHSDCILERQA